MKNKCFLFCFLVLGLLFISCKESNNTKVSGNYYTNNVFEDVSTTCPLYFSFGKDSLKIQYSNASDQWNFKVDYIGKDSMRLRNSKELFIRYYEKDKALILIDTVTKFNVNKDTLELYPMEIGYMERKGLDYNLLNGFWYNDDFFIKQDKPQKNWFRIENDSIYMFSNIHEDYEVFEGSYKILTYGEMSIFSLKNFGSFLEDAPFLVDYIDDKKVQFIYRNCDNDKYIIHLKRVTKEEFLNRKLKEIEYPELEDISFDDLEEEVPIKTEKIEAEN